MALRPEIALQAGKIQSPLAGVADAFLQGKEYREKRELREAKKQELRDKQSKAEKDATLEAFKNAWSGVNQLPKEQRTFDNVKKIIQSQESLTGVDLPDEQLASDFDPETGILDDSVFQGLGASLGLVDKPEEFTLKPGEQRFRGNEVIASVEKPKDKSFLLSPSQLKQSGFAEDAIVQKGPGGFKVLSEGMTEVKKQEQELKKLKLQAEQEQNALKRKEIRGKIAERSLKIEEMKNKSKFDREQKILDFKKANGNLDNMIQTVNNALAFDDDVFEWATGPIASRIPTFGQKTADFEAILEQLEAQMFIENVSRMRGLGAISDSEGAKLSIALQNLDLKQSPEKIKKNLQEILRIANTAKSWLKENHEAFNPKITLEDERDQLKKELGL